MLSSIACSGRWAELKPTNIVPCAVTVPYGMLRRKDVTLQLLWLEYKEGAPDGYQYSQFCHRYREWQRHLDVVMRQEHHAAEKLFVDWAGRTVPITGVITPGQLFVAVLGASNYLYAEAFPSQELAERRPPPLQRVQAWAGIRSQCPAGSISSRI